MRVTLHPDLEDEPLERAPEVVLNESLNVVLARAGELTGEVVTIKELLDEGTRALIVGRADEERVCELAGDPRRRAAPVGRHRPDGQPRPGCCSRSCPAPRSRSSCSRRCPTSATPTSAASTSQIEQIADAVELPFLHQDLFAEHKLPAPKGILLYGPPGLRQDAHRQGGRQQPRQEGRRESRGNDKARSYFLNIKGPELLNKYVGETERQIRLVFQRAREKSEEGWPVIVFFDEMDSMFRTRGTGISSDMESTIVPQLLAEIDGVESLQERHRDRRLEPRGPHRPGHPAPGPPRREDQDRAARHEAAAAQIFGRYLTADLPLAEGEVESLGGGDRDKARARR